jgi:hypothetical protein
MSGYDWSKVKQYPPLREQMLEIIAWAQRRDSVLISNDLEINERGNFIVPDELYTLAAVNGVSRHTLRQRINIGWDVVEAATKPPTPRQKYSSEWKAIANQNGISDMMFWQRISRMGWSEEKAATTSKKEAYAAFAVKRSTKIISLEEAEQAERNGIRRATVLYRLKAGWSKEDALTLPVIPTGERKRRGRQLKEKKCGSCKGCANAQVTV